jgi:hypothetical protein
MRGIKLISRQHSSCAHTFSRMQMLGIDLMCIVCVSGLRCAQPVFAVAHTNIHCFVYAHSDSKCDAHHTMRGQQFSIYTEFSTLKAHAENSLTLIRLT